MDMMNQMLEERKKLFKGGNYSQYVRANGVRVPAVVIAIDNYASFREGFRLGVSLMTELL